MRTYRVRREWTVVMESWIEVQAETPEAAAAIALGDDDYDNQRIADGSDGPTEIGRIVEVMLDGGEVERPVPA